MKKTSIKQEQDPLLRARIALGSELKHAMRRLDEAAHDVKRLQARVASLTGDMPDTPVPTKPGPGDRTGIEMKVLEYLRGAGPTAIQTLFNAFPPHNNAVKEALRRLRRKVLVKGGDRSGMYSAPARAIPPSSITAIWPPYGQLHRRQQKSRSFPGFLVFAILDHVRYDES